jgi:hypothetical protein
MKQHLAPLLVLLSLLGAAWAMPDGYRDAPLPANFDGEKFMDATGAAQDDFYASGGTLYYRDTIADQGDLTQHVPTAQEVTERQKRDRERRIEVRRVLRSLLVILKRIEAAHPGILDGTEVDAIIAEVQGS